MVDSPQNKEISSESKPDQSLDSAQKEAVIGRSDAQQEHSAAFQIAHSNDRTLSQPELIALQDGESIADYNKRVAEIQANRFSFFGEVTPEDMGQKPRDHEQSIIASNVTSISPQADTFTSAPDNVREKDYQYQNTTGDEEPELIAQNWNSLKRQLEKGLDRVGQTVGYDEFRHVDTPPKNGDWHFPHRGQEDLLVSREGAEKAFKLLPNLKSLNPEIGPKAIDPELISAIIRNEQFFYQNGKDSGPDEYVRRNGKWIFSNDESLGPAQIQVRHIIRLSATYPEVLGEASTAIRRCLQPNDAALFAGAYLDEVVGHIHDKTKPDYIGTKDWETVLKFWKDGKRNEALITAYNPDPNQIANINMQLHILKKMHKH